MCHPAARPLSTKAARPRPPGYSSTMSGLSPNPRLERKLGLGEGSLTGRPHLGPLHCACQGDWKKTFNQGQSLSRAPDMARRPPGNLPPFQEPEDPATLPVSLLLPSPWGPIKKDTEIPMCGELGTGPWVSPENAPMPRLWDTPCGNRVLTFPMWIPFTL